MLCSVSVTGTVFGSARGARNKSNGNPKTNLPFSLSHLSHLLSTY